MFGNRRRGNRDFKKGGNMLHLLIIFLVSVPVLYYSVQHAFIGRGGSYFVGFIWSLYFPAAVIGTVGGAFGASRYATPRFEGRVSKLVVFTIPSVGSMDVLPPALSRVIQSILTFAPLHLDRFRIDVVVDEGSEGIPTLLRTFGGDSINLVTVPSGFRCRNGGAKNKARALEYARIVREREGGLARDDVFIYHLDDDTAVGGADTIKSIAQFISEDDGVSYHLAQGVLSFPYDLSKSWIARVADSIRPSDDLTRFHFFTGILGRPLAGLHGEHLLVRSSVENRIGWDFGVNRLEDSYFGLVFSQLYPGKSKFLNSFVYGGASPPTIYDFIKQRRRWYSGFLQLVFSNKLRPKVKIPMVLYTISYAVSPFQYAVIVVVASMLFGVQVVPDIPWLVPLWAFTMAYQLWMYLEGFRINRYVTKHMRIEWWYNALVIPLIYISGGVEAVAAAHAIADFVKKKDSFHVIRKPM